MKLNGFTLMLPLLDKVLLKVRDEVDSNLGGCKTILVVF